MSIVSESVEASFHKNIHITQDWALTSASEIIENKALYLGRRHRLEVRAFAEMDSLGDASYSGVKEILTKEINNYFYKDVKKALSEIQKRAYLYRDFKLHEAIEMAFTAIDV